MNTVSKSSCYQSLATLFTGLVITIAIYWPGLRGPFFFDDTLNITLLEGIRLKTLTFDSIRLAMESGHSGPLGRPLSQLSFALNYYFHEFNPFPYKLINLAIHILNGVLVYAVTIRLLTATRPQNTNENSRLVAAFIAMAWMLHPIQLTSVLYVVQRMTSLSSFFLFSAVALHIKARQSDSMNRTNIIYLLLAWLVFWPLSVFSKESGLLFFGFIIAYEAIIQRKIKHGIDLFGRTLISVALLSAIAFTIYILTPIGREWILASYALRSFTLTERLLTESRVIWTYIELILAPRLNAFALYHDDIAVSSSPFKPWTTLTAIIGIIGLIITGWHARFRNPLLSLAIAWFLISQSLESTIFSLELVHEHRNYVGLLGILLLPVVLLRTVEHHKTLRLAVSAILITFLFFSAFTTALRSHEYGDGLRRALMEAEYHPLSLRSNLTAGSELVKAIAPKDRNAKWYNLVRKYNEQAVKLDPDSKSALFALIDLNCISGLKTEVDWVNELAKQLAKNRLPPSDSNLLFSIKEIALKNRNCLENSDIRRLFDAALSNPSSTMESRMFMYVWYSEYLIFHENNLADAKTALMKAMAIAPQEPHLKERWEILMRIANERKMPHS